MTGYWFTGEARYWRSQSPPGRLETLAKRVSKRTRQAKLPYQLQAKLPLSRKGV